MTAKLTRKEFYKTMQNRGVMAFSFGHIADNALDHIESHKDDAQKEIDMSSRTREVAATRSFGLELRTSIGEISYLRHHKGDSYYQIELGTGKKTALIAISNYGCVCMYQ